MRNYSAGREDLWLQLVARYPYALKHDQYPDVPSSREMAAEIYDWTGEKIPWVRADWFVATATQPPLYHTLLYDAVLPELKNRARVNVKLANGTAEARTSDDRRRPGTLASRMWRPMSGEVVRPAECVNKSETTTVGI